jgi:hypothetical protein
MPADMQTNNYVNIKEQYDKEAAAEILDKKELVL